MVTCRDILNLNMDGVNLIAGEAGLNRMVSWVYLVQTKNLKKELGLIHSKDEKILYSRIIARGYPLAFLY